MPECGRGDRPNGASKAFPSDLVTPKRRKPAPNHGVGRGRDLLPTWSLDFVANGLPDK
jgi:hypothetical protein